MRKSKICDEESIIQSFCEVSPHFLEKASSVFSEVETSLRLVLKLALREDSSWDSKVRITDCPFLDFEIFVVLLGENLVSGTSAL
jgi:hypothetical protein